MELDSPYFKRSEFACKCGCGFDTVDARLFDLMVYIRTYMEAPVIITSGCRCPAHNKAVGGADNSQHLYGRAVDFYVDGVSLETVHEFCTSMMDAGEEGGLGYYPRKDRGWIHIDSRTNGPARWKG